MISLEEFKSLEDLSKLRFTEEERDVFFPNLNSIIDFISVVAKVEVKANQNIKTIKLKDLREDIAEVCFTQDEVVSNAPMKDKGCFAVPKIVD